MSTLDFLEKNPWQIHIVFAGLWPSQTTFFFNHQSVFSPHVGVAVLNLISLTSLGALHVYLFLITTRKKKKKQTEQQQKHLQHTLDLHRRVFSWFLNTRANISRHFSHFLPDYGNQSLSALLETVQSSAGWEPVSHNSLWTLTAGRLPYFVCACACAGYLKWGRGEVMIDSIIMLHHMWSGRQGDLRQRKGDVISVSCKKIGKCDAWGRG